MFFVVFWPARSLGCLATERSAVDAGGGGWPFTTPILPANAIPCNEPFTNALPLFLPFRVIPMASKKVVQQATCRRGHQLDCSRQRDTIRMIQH